MADLIDRLRGIYRIPITDGLGAVGGGDEPDNPNEFIRSFPVPPIHREAAAEIERLTAELASARALLAQYEQAPVVGWCANDGSIFTTDEATANVWRRNFDLSPIPLIVRPEAKP